jgi:predicted MFS family arabinose efflux permease
MFAAPLAQSIGDYFEWWQILPVIGIIVLLVFWKIYRSKQM